MTGGHGHLHASVPFCEISAQALQLWVSFIGSEKMLELQYQEIRREEIQKKPGGKSIKIKLIHPPSTSAFGRTS